MVICLERVVDLLMAQLIPLPLTVSCFGKIQIGFTFLVPANPGSPGKGPLNGGVCVCVCFREMAESGVDVICERSRNVLLLGLSDDDEANRLSLLVLMGHGIGTLRKNSVIVQPLSNVCVFCRTSAKTGIMSQSSLITSQS